MKPKDYQYTKHVCQSWVLLQDRGFSTLIESTVEAIEDHIRDNLKRDIDKPQIEFLRAKQDKLRGLI